MRAWRRQCVGGSPPCRKWFQLDAITKDLSQAIESSKTQQHLAKYLDLVFDFGVAAANAIIHMSSMRERLRRPSGFLRSLSRRHAHANTGRIGVSLCAPVPRMR